MVDIDRLHGVLSGKVRGRGVGKTRAIIETMAGEIETGDSSVVVFLMFRYRDLSYLRPMFEEVMEEHGLGITWKGRDRAYVSGKVVLFCVDEPVGVEASIYSDHWRLA